MEGQSVGVGVEGTVAQDARARPTTLAAVDDAYLALAVLGKEWPWVLGQVLKVGVPVGVFLAVCGITQPSWVTMLRIEDLGSLEREPLLGMARLPSLVRWLVPMLAFSLIEPLLAWRLHQRIWWPRRGSGNAGDSISRCLLLSFVPAALAALLAAGLASLVSLPGPIAFVLMPLLVTLMRAPTLAAAPLIVLERADLREALRTSVRVFRARPLALLSASLILLWLALLVEGLLLAPSGVAGCLECSHSKSILCHFWWQPMTAWCAMLPLLALHALGFVEYLELRRGGSRC